MPLIDRLADLAEAHVVADQRAAGADSKQRSLRLMGMERRLQKCEQLGVGSAEREQLCQLCRAVVRIPPSGGEIERVVIGTELVIRLRSRDHEGSEFAQTFVGQHAIAVEIERIGGGLPQCGRAIRTGPETQAAFAVVAQVQLGECRPIATRERRLRAAPLLQLGECELDVLAGAEFAGRVVGTRTEVVAGLGASDRDAIAGFGDGIADPEVGEHRFAAEILQLERLLASELPAQAALPIRRLHTVGRMGPRELGFLGRFRQSVPAAALVAVPAALIGRRGRIS